MIENTPRQTAMLAATMAAKKVITQSKNKRTTLGQMKADGVAYHAASAAIEAFEISMARSMARTTSEDLYSKMIEYLIEVSTGRTP